MTPLEFLKSLPVVEGEGRPGTVLNPYLFDATDEELKWFMLVCMVVAGKNARVQQDKLWQFFNRMGYMPNDPDWMRHINEMADYELLGLLRDVKMGQYTRLVKSIKTLACRVEGGQLDLRACTRADLVDLPGVGLKTASFFMIYTQEKLKGVACLDTHILKFIRDSGLDPAAPNSTPAPIRYLELERRFTALCEEAGRPVAEADFDIWSYYSNKKQ